MFTTTTFEGEVGKVVVIVNSTGTYGKTVEQVIRVSDGKELLTDSSRPCDSLADAIDVAYEMLQDEGIL